MWRIARVARRPIRNLGQIVRHDVCSSHPCSKSSPTISIAPQRLFCSTRPRWNEVKDSSLAGPAQGEVVVSTSGKASKLPTTCPGCGAFSQIVDPEAPGYYKMKVKRLQTQQALEAERIMQEAMSRMAAMGEMPFDMDMTSSTVTEPSANKVPVCDRCHYLKYQSKGASIVHPSMHSIRSIIESSPHRQNHIYHVLDAADFPMSLIPNLMTALRLPRLRTQNRRSKTIHYVRGRVAEVTFIITRSDLLAPQKEQVDRLMPYLQEVLREALGQAGHNVRLTNVRCVSAVRGWWTPEVKRDIWSKGGAGWFVGKVNVGKSALFEAVFPKGKSGPDTAEYGKRSVQVAQAVAETDSASQQSRGEDGLSKKAETQEEVGENQGSNDLVEPSLDALWDTAKSEDSSAATKRSSQIVETITPAEEEDQDVVFDEDENASLLPPLQPETAYPQMPLVSSLPGTTASPIRVPFGKGKGELIDLPGIERSLLETHVRPEHKSSLVMRHRVVPEQQSINPGQSLLIGGMIRLTPTTDENQFLAYSFTPLKSHSTSTVKAMAIQTGLDEDGLPYAGTVETISTESAKQNMKSAGRFTLKWDITKQRAGPLTNPVAGKQRASNLPFIVYGADVLIEGVGWVELTCQVRRFKSRDQFTIGPERDSLSDMESKTTLPEVEIFSPYGKFVGIRKPMNAWLIGGPKKKPQHAQRARPRMTISMKRRQEGGRRGSPQGTTRPA
jgi:ribosome biogenesis GTPase A